VYPFKYRKIIGIVLTTELILLTVAVTMFAIIGIYGISRIIVNQATSSKTTFTVINGNAWRIGTAVAVSLYVQNTGSQPVNIVSIGVTDGNTVCTTSLSQAVTLNPGEAKVISSAMSCNINAGSKVQIFAVDSSGMRVGTVATVNNP